MKKEQLLKSISDMLKKHEDFLNENPEVFHAIEERFFKAIDDEDYEEVPWEDTETGALYDDEEQYGEGDYGYEDMFDPQDEEGQVYEQDMEEADDADRWLEEREAQLAEEEASDQAIDADAEEVRPVQEEEIAQESSAAVSPEQEADQKKKSLGDWSPRDDYTPEQMQQMQEFMDQGYSHREAERLARAHIAPPSLFAALKSRFNPSEPSPKMLEEMKDIAKKWLYDMRRNTEYDPKKNPILNAGGKTLLAHEEAHGEFSEAYNNFLQSDELKGLSRKERRQAIKDFKQNWHDQNPNYRDMAITAADSGVAYSENAEIRKQELMDGLAAILDAGKIHITDDDQGYSAQAAGMSGGAISDQAAAQMVGGVSGDDQGPQATIKKDPAMIFAEKNPEVVKQLKEKLQAQLSPDQNERMSALGAFRKPETAEPKEQKPEAPKKTIKTIDDKGQQYINDYLLEYAPLINIKSSTLGRNAPEHIDDGDLIMAGMHGLIDAFNTYDPSRGASFKSHAGRRIEGIMRDYIKAGGPNSVDGYFYDQVRKRMGRSQEVSQPAAATEGPTASAAPAELDIKKPEGSE